VSQKRVTGGKCLEKKGLLHVILKFVYHKALKYPLISSIKLFNKKGNDIIDEPFLTFAVPVEKITYKVESPSRPPLHRTLLRYQIRNVGLITDGDWDLHLVKFSDEKIYLRLKERFIERKEWEATSYYEMFKKYKGQKEVLYCKTWEEYQEKRLRFFDELYNDIKINGYKKQVNPEDEVSVAISREGQILFIDGHHRLTMAKILNIKEIPVIVHFWHKQYIEKLKRKNHNKKITALYAFNSIETR
jgi:hypothetical protein